MKWIFALFLIPTLVMAQEADEAPYAQIPDYPADYAPGNVLSRLVDGLGYRYYWATEGLRSEDLDYQIVTGARSTRQTLDHIYGLTQGVLSASRGVANESTAGAGLSYEALRLATLNNLKEASENFAGKGAEELSQLAVIFKSSYKTREFPLWHIINGQVSDAIYHTGQVVSYRRASGNPMNPKVNVFQGRNRE